MRSKSRITMNKIKKRSKRRGEKRRGKKNYRGTILRAFRSPFSITPSLYSLPPTLKNFPIPKRAFWKLFGGWIAPEAYAFTDFFKRSRMLSFHDRMKSFYLPLNVFPSFHFSKLLPLQKGEFCFKGNGATIRNQPFSTFKF